MSDSPQPATDGSMVTINMPCQYGYLRIARQSVMDFCARANVSEFKAGQLEMAVDEACSNIIEHSYGGEVDLSTQEDGEVHPGLQINLMRQENRVVVEICDAGKGFEMEQTPVVGPDQFLQEERSRGLGMFIINNFVDELKYTRGSDGAPNSLRLTKLI